MHNYAFALTRYPHNFLSFLFYALHFCFRLYTFFLDVSLVAVRYTYHKCALHAIHAPHSIIWKCVCFRYVHMFKLLYVKNVCVPFAQTRALNFWLFFSSLQLCVHTMHFHSAMLSVLYDHWVLWYANMHSDRTKPILGGRRRYVWKWIERANMLGFGRQTTANFEWSIEHTACPDHVNDDNCRVLRQFRICIFSELYGVVWVARAMFNAFPPYPVWDCRRSIFTLFQLLLFSFALVAFLCDTLNRTSMKCS